MYTLNSSPPGAKLLNKLGYSGSDISYGADKQVVQSVEDLADVFTHFLRKETAAERAVVGNDCWQQILTAINALEDQSEFIGGNAALIARTMSLHKIAVS